MVYLIDDKIHHVSTCVSRHEKAFYLYIPDAQRLTVAHELLFVVYRHLRQLVKMIYHLAAHLAGEISVFRLADIKLCLFKKPRAVSLDRAHMVGVLMCN